jgi:hypothetical protein
MSSTEHCIEQLDAVRDAAADPRAAYVIRSRLERLLLSCARLIAEENAPSAPPDMPRALCLLPNDANHVRALAAACNELHDLTGVICRPSESLDARWESGWLRIEAALDRLEAVLRSQPQLV